MRRLFENPQQLTAVLLCLTCSQFGFAQELSIAPERPSAPIIVRPYRPPTIPPPHSGNAVRLADLIHDGTLYLTAYDAVALALDNQIDVEITRYDKYIAAWNLERAQAGGALPGVPSSASQAGTVASGQGVAGSQQAAGVSIAGANPNTNRNTNATISQIGPVTQVLDPIISETSTFSHTSIPQPNIVQSVVPNLISNTKVFSGSYQQGFLTGGSLTVNYSDHYLNENAPTDLLNPSVAPNLAISGQQNLLRGFGVAVNARNITIAKMNLQTSDLNFKSRVIGIVAQVLNAYYTLIGDYEDLKSKKTAADFSQTFLRNVQEQIRLGALAPSDEINARSQAVTTQQAVADSEANLKEQELTLKNLISRNSTADPALKNARIVPVDKIVIPDSDKLPPIDDLVKQATANRSDIAAEQANVRVSETSALGTKNGLLPTLAVIGGESHAGLAGTPHTVNFGNFVESPDPYFIGGIGTALGQVFRRNFPTNNVGTFMVANLHNSQAQADYAIDQLQLRQTRLTTTRDVNQVQVVIMNDVIALQQARARYEAAVHNRILQEQLFTAEQKKFSLGASTPYDVTQQQRDLVTSQAGELSALVTYKLARISLDQALGATLDANHINIEQVRDAAVPVKPAAAPPGE